MAWVLHLDVDAFFAAVEQRDDARLRGRPVAVGTGVVASCSYESRPWGVRTGMRLTDARRLCPSLIVLPGDYRRYEIASRRILGICHEVTPRVEMAALDDLYLGVDSGWDEAVTSGGWLARQVMAEVGLRVSLGLATNKLVAAVATQQVKDRKARSASEGSSPDLAAVPAGRERSYLAPWPVEILPGVGPKALEQLTLLNVRRVEQLAEVPPALLANLFGARGPALRDLARGLDPRRVEPSKPSRSVSRCTSFDPAESEWPVLSAMLDHLVDRAASWLRLHGQATKGVAVRLRYADHAWSDNRLSLSQPSHDEADLKAAARDRLRRAYTRRLPLRLVGVELSPLTEPCRQGELFVDAERERRGRLRACRDEIRERFGFLAIVGGTALELAGRVEHDRDNYRLRTPCLTR